MSAPLPESAPSLAVVSLLPAQRRQRIVEFLRRHGAVTLVQLEQALEVSVSTLRRDLDSLAAEGVIDRTHGGALLRQQGYTAFEPDSVASSELSPREKRAIGTAAAAALQPHQSVIFDSGSTVLEAARAAVARGLPFTAVTNDLAIAQALGASPQVQVHVFGGQLRPGSQTLVGEQLIEAARAIQADVLLCGAHAITGGIITETSPEVAAVKRALMRAAVSRRLLVDASKFRPRTFMQVATLDEVDEIYCDDALPADEAEHLRNLGKRLTLVPVTG
ncbi:DeoR/GlpR family DNA-binding transcription regulator [Ideonella livida]|uniref:DeoR/GlpR transcriptional regulator n=1 Tax=Ideonella livida TaxID=2707176 RepID=A0A7C9PI47_9BURK|nr:DeoR/GlpR family DNA-binding transcription regulator [Ideonella livida]NDY92496.1 DeoR/GlpR transcriptional regulator [Ideonella livida]